MLKALELVGFKSFADKTRFEFPAGITVVVGPNGSGKSNIVDAVKWVLGEQSAKSLRGKDMADVIFKGAGAGGRKPMNMAEATIVFDNSAGQLGIDAPEVHVTRRVYRSGEGEYLINRQPCRLKDIRDLFRGTGVGVDAYSLIEQGKVDRLLQASPKDRRAIFEEAAGISRFKAKKIEAQRRLERVDQNLLRLRDIVEEVESRLKTVRAQASKAQRYRQYSERLQELRTQVGQVDWRALSAKLAAIEESLAKLRNESASLSAGLERREARTLELETELTSVGENLRATEGRFAKCREQIAASESQVEHQRSRRDEFAEQVRALRGNIATMSTRVVDSLARLKDTLSELAAAEADHQRVAQSVETTEAALHEQTRQHDQIKSACDARRQQLAAQLRTAATLASQASTLESQQAVVAQTLQRTRARLAELVDASARLDQTLDELRGREMALVQLMAERSAAISATDSELDEERRLHARRQQDLIELQSKRRAVAARATLLEELEEQLAGLASGVQDVLRATATEATGPLSEIRGVVADFIRSPVQFAPLIDAALGPAAQYLVVSGDEFLAALAVGDVELTGRISLTRLDLTNASTFVSPDLSRRAGVIARASQVVEVDAEYQDLVQRLLGGVWLVEGLPQALALQAQFPGVRLVTRAGEVIDADGTLHVGSGGEGSGLISRRSELRALKLELTAIDHQIVDQENELARINTLIKAHEAQLRVLTEEQQADDRELAEQRFGQRTVEEQRQQVARQQAVLTADETLAMAQQEELAEQRIALAEKLQTAEAAVVTAEDLLQRDEAQLATLAADRDLRLREVTTQRIALAKSEQRLETIRARRVQLEDDQRERERASTDARSQLAQSLQRGQQAELTILAATGQLAELFLLQESLARDATAAIDQQKTLLELRQTLSDEVAQMRRQLRKLDESQHAEELAANEVRHERQTLADRLRDDYGIEIGALEVPPDAATPGASESRLEVEEEISALRRKINNIGAVNLDALVELDEIEARYASLKGQFDDLTQAKEALERIIHKINNDSRRLFIETLEAIRTNFQALYRKAFGGGHADIMLEEGSDILECGIEIMATPPGKPSFNNSLLSGGEKALTAVALLLAIFQFRPSPFCVLDEVDAPFDEANIGRFVDVLRDFLGWTKFVIVTHSKKTMTAATTLYGVTMQESGVSKRVSVRFEDVSEDGQISQDAVARQFSTERRPADENAA